MRITADPNGTRPVLKALPPVVPPPAIHRQAQHSGEAAPPHRPVLPRHLTSFIGRTEERSLIRQRLEDPTCRLLTLLGPGGIGKTRLALEVVAGLADDFVDGIFFVNLQPLAATDQLPQAIADAIGVSLTGTTPVDAQLFHMLSNREMLLVLDNFEQLVAGASFVSELLAQTHHVKALVTSREALNLDGEWLFPVAGLDFAADQATDPEALQACGAVQLFAERTRRMRPGFALADEAAAVAQICRLVEGMPLALELAATWTMALTCTEIAAEIERGIEFLETNQRNAPERHRSITAVFAESWRQLTAEEQAVFARLSVFRGGFRRTAAEQVAGASLATLSKLVGKSLVRWEASGRYQLHELLRQFGAEKLASDPVEAGATQEEHSRHFLAFLNAHAEALNSAAQRRALDEIHLEIDNVRAAWAWAVAQRDMGAIEQSVEMVYEFYLIRSRYQEGQALFAGTVAQLQGRAADGVSQVQPAVVDKLVARQGALLAIMGEFTEAGRLLQPLAATEDKFERAFVLRQLGRVAWYQQDKKTTEAHYRASLAISRALGDRSGEILTILSLADQITNLGKIAEAGQLAEECLALCRDAGRPDWLAAAHQVMAWCLSCTGHYDEAAAHLDACLAIFEQIGDRFGIASALSFQGWVAWCRGGAQLAEAIAYHRRALALFDEVDSHSMAAMCLGDLALALNDAGDHVQAQQAAQAGLAIAEPRGSSDLMIYHLYGLGDAAAGQGDFATARQHLLRALHMSWEFSHLPHLAATIYCIAKLLARESALPELPVAERRQKLRAAADLLALLLHFPAAWQALKERSARLLAEIEAVLPAGTVVEAANATHDLQEVVDAAATLLSAPAPTPRPAAESPATPSQPLAEPLTTRELEVLRLVAEGLTNQVIAERLILSTGTVKWYTNAIYGKLGVTSRTQAVLQGRKLKLIE